MKYFKKIMFGIIVVTLLSISYAETAPKVVRAYLGVYKYNGTYYDPLGNTFNGASSYKGSEYYYTVIVYELSNGQRIRQVVSLKDNYGTTNPAPTVALSWTGPDGTTHSIFNQFNGQTKNVTSLPYITEIPIGSKINLKMNDNYNDNNYGDGSWTLNVTENGIAFEHATEGGGFFHNTSFVFTDIATNKTWNVTMPYKNKRGNEYYSGVIPLNGSNAIIYNISGNTPDSDKSLTFAPPENFILAPAMTSAKAPIPIGVLILSTILITYILYRRSG